MERKMRIAFVCFGEVNTPYERLVIKHDEALAALSSIGADIIDAGIVIDDAAYKTADKAIKKLKYFEMDCLIICVAGWIPTHAVIRVTDVFRNKPMLLWGLCGWTENGKIITTAGQAGTTAIRPAFEAMNYKFKYVYNVIGEPLPLEKITAFLNACYSASRLRTARIGTMGYRDMLLYGTQFEGNSLRAEIGVEVEPFEIYEMVQNTGNLDDNDIEKSLKYIRENWKFEKPCDDKIIKTGVKYALAIGKKIEERNFDAVTLIDVDGMKKLLGFPPAMVFMLLDHCYSIPTTPENDVLGNVMQLILKYITGQNAAYMEYYEFFKNSVLIGVPDYVPSGTVKGDIKVKPTAFGLLSTSLLNVSEVKSGLITCARLIYKNNGYYMHIYTGNAKPPPLWEEFGWEAPAPLLPSLEVEMISCTVQEFAQKVSSQHVIIAYGDHTESLKDFCSILGIQVL